MSLEFDHPLRESCIHFMDDIDTLLIIFNLLPLGDQLAVRAVCSLWRKLIDYIITRPRAQYRAIITWNLLDAQLTRQLVTFDAHYHAHKSGSQHEISRGTLCAGINSILEYLNIDIRNYCLSSEQMSKFHQATENVYPTLGRFWPEQAIPIINDQPLRGCIRCADDQSSANYDIAPIIHFVTCSSFMSTTNMRWYHYTTLMKQFAKYFVTREVSQPAIVHLAIFSAAYELSREKIAALDGHMKAFIDIECCEDAAVLRNQYTIIEAYHTSRAHNDFHDRLTYCYDVLRDLDDGAPEIGRFCSTLVAYGYSNVVDDFRAYAPEDIPDTVTISDPDAYIIYITHAYRSAKNRGISLESSLEEFANYFSIYVEYTFDCICQAYEAIFAEIRWYNIRRIVHPFTLIDKWIERTTPSVAREISEEIIRDIELSVSHDDRESEHGADLAHDVTYQLAKHVISVTSA